MSRIAIVTLGDEKVRDWNSVSFPNKAKYCADHGYDFIGLSRSLDTNRAPGWSKVLLLLEHLNDYDYLFWSDTDSLIVEPSVRLESLLTPDKDFVICMGGIPNCHWSINTGEFFIRNTPWSHSFLHTVWNHEFLVNNYDHRWTKEEFMDHDGPAYTARSELHETLRRECNCHGCCGYKMDQKSFIHTLHHMSDNELKAHVVAYEPDDPKYFNGYGEFYKLGCFIHHFPGGYKEDLER